MAITQLNNYLPGQNLTNLSENVDYNRVGDDKTDITINHTTSPWTFTIKVGSLIEIDGNFYTVDTADYILQATDNAHNYIVFTGSDFASSASRGTYDPAKGGFYDSGNRVLKYYIDPDNDLEYTIVDNSSRTNNLKIDNDLTIGNDVNGSINCFDYDNTSISYLFNYTYSEWQTSNPQVMYLDLYKPAIFYFESSVTGTDGGARVTTLDVDTDISINGSWVPAKLGGQNSSYVNVYDTFFSFTGTTTGTDNSFLFLIPGQYRFTYDYYVSASFFSPLGNSAYFRGQIVSCYGHDDLTNTGNIFAIS